MGFLTDGAADCGGRKTPGSAAERASLSGPGLHAAFGALSEFHPPFYADQDGRSRARPHHHCSQRAANLICERPSLDSRLRGNDVEKRPGRTGRRSAGTRGSGATDEQ